jgi:transglutaminase-like putative cysteine protease
VKFEDFRSRALREGLRYGEDRLVFLRELAQNARDAGASRIDVVTRLEGGDLVIEFTDDGEGMSYDHARKYLFTLYASSKEGDVRSAGRYGVGFWSVLLFSPDSIAIESMTGDGESWANSFDGRLEYQSQVRCALAARGTRVRLRRLIRDEDPARIMAQLDDSLKRYCRYLRRNDKAASVLAITLNGSRIDRQFRVDGPCWMAFRNGAVEGAVGLGHRPGVELYARGLLVWHGTTINELRYGAEAVDDATHPEGLAPVYVLNGNNLSVTLDRRAVVDDKELARVRRVARRRMRELVGRYLDSVSPRPASERLRDLFAGVWEDLRLGGGLIPAVIVLGVLLAVTGALLALWSWTGRPVPGIPGPGSPAQQEQAGPRPTPTAPSTQVALGPENTGDFGGPMVEPLPGLAALDLSYSPADRAVSFRTVPAETLHAGKGIVSRPQAPALPAPPYRCATGCLDVEVAVDAGPGVIPVPTPTGHRIEPDSVLLSDGGSVALLTSEAGQPLLRLDRKTTGALHYRAGPGTEILEPARWNELLTVPADMRLPPSYATVAATAAAAGDPARKVETIAGFVRAMIAYDRSAPVSLAYRRFASAAPTSGWTEFVTTLGRGDCDVKNTIAVLMLRRSGVPARLAVGYPGEGGRAAPGMHAWIEYHDGTWLAADSTGAPTTPASLQPPAGPAESPAAADRPWVEPSSPSGPARQPGMPAVEPAPHDRGLASGAPRVIALVAAFIAAFFGAAGLLLLLMGRSDGRINAPGGRDARQKIAAQMLGNAIAQPGIWLRGSGLSSRRLLPVLGQAARMSLQDAERLARRGRLWQSTGRPEPVREAVSHGNRVLDASDEAFGAIIARIQGAVDLDDLFSVFSPDHQGQPAELAEATRLIGEVDQLVGMARWPAGTVVSSPQLVGAVSRDVDLTGLRILRPERGTKRFVVVSPSHPEVSRRAR